MKSFVLIMFVSVGLATVAAVAIARAVFPETTAAPANSRTTANATGEFTPEQGIETVAQRFGSSPAAERRKQAFREGARATPHTQASHWTVQYGGAIWTAHGNGDDGPYASPENGAARQFEAEAGGP
jgi:hypothetical protein